MSLQILKGVKLQNYPNTRIGIMANANASKNFQQAFKKYPCDNLQRCDAIGGKPCPFPDRQTQCPTRKHILGHIVKMCDSGAFSKEGAMLSYEQLFEAYVQMGIDYGIMIDMLWNAETTIKSARQAQTIYQNHRDGFKLVVVAQGKTVEENLECYDRLKNLGFEYIAVGGLLRRSQNTVRYVSVGNEQVLFDVLKSIRNKYPNNWLFALGCFNIKRIKKLHDLNVCANYKGWIFKYEKRNQTLNNCLQLVDLENINTEQSRSLIYVSELKKQMERRFEYINKQKKMNKTLYKKKRILRQNIADLHQKSLKKIRTH